MHIEIASAADLEWVNQQYDKIGFQHSTLTNELLAIAKVNDNRAGIGRLINIDKSTAELGGMYVLTEYRNQGIAEQLVDFLLTTNTSAQTIYCIPFTHLAEFYQRFGFSLVDKLTQVPIAIADKLNWCEQTYSQPTLLYSLERKSIK